MLPPPFFSLLGVLGLFGIFCMLHLAWPSPCPATPQRPGEPSLPRRPRSSEPPAFAGLTPQPPWVACAQAPPASLGTAPAAPPPRTTSTRGRKRQVDTGPPVCLNPDCPSRGWGAGGTFAPRAIPRAGPGGSCWGGCRRSFRETLGTLFHGKRPSVERIVRVLAGRAAGRGSRGTARVFAVDPNTVPQWLVAAAAPRRAFSQPCLHDVQVRQGQRDELCALRSAVKEGGGRAMEAIERLERAPRWVWVAIAPESTLLLAIDGGNRTLAMAQRVVHHVAQVLAPDCAPLGRTAGCTAYRPALLTHYGPWGQRPRRHAKGPAPQPRGLPLPARL
jgi:hypothetical protein